MVQAFILRCHISTVSSVSSGYDILGLWQASWWISFLKVHCNARRGDLVHLVWSSHFWWEQEESLQSLCTWTVAPFCPNLWANFKGLTSSGEASTVFVVQVWVAQLWQSWFYIRYLHAVRRTAMDVKKSVCCSIYLRRSVGCQAVSFNISLACLS